MGMPSSISSTQICKLGRDAAIPQKEEEHKWRTNSYIRTSDIRCYVLEEPRANVVDYCSLSSVLHRPASTSQLVPPAARDDSNRSHIQQEKRLEGSRSRLRHDFVAASQQPPQRTSYSPPVVLQLFRSFHRVPGARRHRRKWRRRSRM